MRLLIAMLFCTAIPAQPAITSPPGYTTTEGPSSAATLNPMLFQSSRFQYSDTATVGPKVITALQLRRDGVLPTTVFASRIVSADIVFASSGSRSGIFASNYATTPTIVFGTANINLPVLAPPATPPAPWAILIALNTPYLHSSASGFLWEIRVYSNAGVSVNYTLDAHPGASAGTGSCSPIGSATCITRNGTFSLVSNNPVTDPTNVTTFSYSAVGGPTNAAAMLALSTVPGTFPGILCGTLYMGNPIVIVPAGQTNASGVLPTVSFTAPFAGPTALRAQALALDMSQLIVPLAITQCQNCTPAMAIPGSVSVLYSTMSATATTGTRMSSQYLIVNLL